MFSLADEIEKFEETILTLPENIMTLDQRFLGGGIKMQDLIQENSFIIQEMRKFKSIFLNYCKLNDKIYNKIIEHEVNSNDHYNKILTVSSTIDRKLQHYDQEIKKTKEDMQARVFGLREFVEAGIKDLNEECGRKVSEEGYVNRVKKIIEQFEQQNASSPLPSDSDSRVMTNQQNANVPPSGKRRRGLSVEDIEALKSQIIPLIEEVNQKLTQNSMRISDVASTLQSHGVKLGKHEQQQKWFAEDILSIRNSIDEVKTYANKQDEKIVEMLRETINENIWTQRFQNFKNKTMMPSIENLSGKFYRSIQDLRKDVEENVKPKFTDINAQISKIREKERTLELRISKNEQRHMEIYERIEQTKQQIMKEASQTSRKFQKQLSQQATLSRNQHEKVQHSLKQLQITIDSIVNITEEAVLKKVEYRMGKEMKQIRGDISMLNRKTSEINTSVKLNGEQVGHVKDIVATKANFTDLLMYFDKKADKQDFKELQGLFSDSPKASNNLNNVEFESQRKVTEQRRRRRSSYSKRMTTPVYTRGEEELGKPLVGGWQSPDTKQANKNILKNSLHNVTGKLKNKSMRPSTANTLFLL